MTNETYTFKTAGWSRAKVLSEAQQMADEFFGEPAELISVNYDQPEPETLIVASCRARVKS